MGNLYYRIANKDTQQGLWYDSRGNYTGLIHNEFNFCMNTNLPMPFDLDLVGWLSATDSLGDLFNWFSKEDIARLEKHVYEINIVNGDKVYEIEYEDGDHLYFEGSAGMVKIPTTGATIYDFIRACELCEIKLELSDYAKSLIS